MAKKKTEEKTIMQEYTENPGLDTLAAMEPIYTAKAYSIVTLPKVGHTVFEIAFNPETGEAKVVKKDHFGNDRVMAKEKFKLSVVLANIL